jgi:predicted double-glycine peptidase
MQLRRSWIVAPALLLGGCATITPFRGVSLDEDVVYVGDVPPVRQDENYACGAAALASVAAHWGVALTDFKARIPHAAADETGPGLQAIAGRLGLQAFSYSGSMADLRDNLGQGRPIIAMIPMPLLPRGGWIAAGVESLWNEVGPRPPHWVTVVGLVGDRWVIIDDPASGPLTIARDRFERWWGQKQNLCVLVAGAPVKSGTVGLNP